MSKNFSLRDYQIDALNQIDKDLKQNDDPVLLVAIMGAGKTVMMARLINKYYYETNKKFLCLMHKKELVEQFINTFNKFTDIPMNQIGVYCAGLNQKELSKRVTVATIQSLEKSENLSGKYDLVIIDECHRVNVSRETMYKKVLTKINKPGMRLLGITATPFRLDHGFIFGNRCVENGVNMFKKINYRIKYKDLKEKGYLCELQGKISHHESLIDDLSDVEVNGDYVIDKLGEVMVKEIHLSTAKAAIDEHCKNYNYICIFCTTIDHAEKLMKIIGTDQCTTIHSQLSDIERQMNMNDWRSGRKKIVTSVNILAEGFDFPSLDCLVFARPTLSSVLFLQALGRVLRVHEGKTHGFLLDLTDNTSRFGVDLDNIRATIPKKIPGEKNKDEMFKLCPICETRCHVALRVCSCGYQWESPAKVEAEKIPDLKHVVFEGDMPDIKEIEVESMHVDVHISKKEKMLGKITFMERNLRTYNMWLCFEDFYDGFAVEKGKQKWVELTNDQCMYPKSCEEFIQRRHEIAKPEKILVDLSKKFPEIIEVIAFNDDEIPF